MTRSLLGALCLSRVYFARRYYTVSFHGRRRKKEVGNPGSLNLERTTNDAPRVRACIRSFYDSRLESPFRGDWRGDSPALMHRCIVILVKLMKISVLFSVYSIL